MSETVEADPRDALIEELVAENAWLRSKVAWGLVHAGNAYRRPPPPPKPEPVPLDVSHEDAPHG